MSVFPFFSIKGDPEQLGQQAGSLFGDRILATYKLYQGLFASLLKLDLSDKTCATQLSERIERCAEPFSHTIAKTFPQYKIEIESMAKAAKLPAWQVYALNARTEIYRAIAKDKKTEAAECTALYFPASQLLGQNWDWHPGLEDLSIVVQIEKTDGHKFVMLTEPGIIGKIGLNSRGLGVCLNILFAQTEMGGVPIHIILRAILESENFEAAVRIVSSVERSTTSNLLVADANGRAVNFELLGSELREVSQPSGALLHTNHYLADEASASAAIPGSVFRLKRATQLYSAHCEEGIAGMKSVLSDREDLDYPICRAYSPGLDFLVGTVASIIMDLKARQFLILRGQSKIDSEWQRFNLA